MLAIQPKSSGQKNFTVGLIKRIIRKQSNIAENQVNFDD